MTRRRALLALLALGALGTGRPAWGESTRSLDAVVEASYALPVERYGHWALGRPHEYARLTATTAGGRRLVFDLPEDEVFEDLAPRIVRLAAGEPESLLTIVSHRANGARLVLLRSRGDRLAIHAQGPPIGRPMRWLNPVGVADLDGDGRAEIAAVLTPHIGGTLTVYRQRGPDLVQVAALWGFSNHVFGSPELALSAPAAIAGRMRLLVPDETRRRLRIMALEDRHLVEVGACALPAPMDGALAPLGPERVSVGIAAGREVLLLRDCLR